MTLDQDTLDELLKFPLMEALTGRRSRRFCMGVEIPDGVFASKSRHKLLPLNELEQLIFLSTMSGLLDGILLLCVKKSHNFFI